MSQGSKPVHAFDIRSDSRYTVHHALNELEPEAVTQFVTWTSRLMSHHAVNSGV